MIIESERFPKFNPELAIPLDARQAFQGTRDVASIYLRQISDLIPAIGDTSDEQTFLTTYRTDLRDFKSLLNRFLKGDPFYIVEDREGSTIAGQYQHRSVTLSDNPDNKAPEREKLTFFVSESTDPEQLSRKFSLSRDKFNGARHGNRAGLFYLLDEGSSVVTELSMRHQKGSPIMESVQGVLPQKVHISPTDFEQQFQAVKALPRFIK